MKAVMYCHAIIRFRVQGSGFRVQGSGFRVQGSRFKVQKTKRRIVMNKELGKTNLALPPKSSFWFGG
jgi:hypothetical protein